MTNKGVVVYTVNLTAESEEGDSSGSVIEFVCLDTISIARWIEEHYQLQVVDTKYTTYKLVHEIGRLLLGFECFDGYSTSDEGNDIGDRVRL